MRRAGERVAELAVDAAAFALLVVPTMVIFLLFWIYDSMQLWSIRRANRAAQKG
jgi:ABC-type transport system involved in Fe-S cluster assembly fused permease/ATPase subunit